MQTRVYSRDGPMLDIRLSDFTTVKERNVLLEYDALVGKIRYALYPMLINSLRDVYSDVTTKTAFARIVGCMNDYNIIPKGLEQLLNFIKRGIQVGDELVRYDSGKDVSVAAYKLLFGMFKRDESQLLDDLHHKCFQRFANKDGHICTPLFTVMRSEGVTEYQKGKVKLRVERLGRGVMGKGVVYCYTHDGGFDFYVDDTQYRTNLAAFSLINSEVAYLQKYRKDKEKARMRVHKLCYFMFSAPKAKTTSTHFITEVVFQHARLHYSRDSDSVTFDVPHLDLCKDENVSYSKMTSMLLKYYIMHIFGWGVKCNGCQLKVLKPLPTSLNIPSHDFPLTMEQRADAIRTRRSPSGAEKHDVDDDSDAESDDDVRVETSERAAASATCLAEKDSDTYTQLGPHGIKTNKRYLQLNAGSKGDKVPNVDTATKEPTTETTQSADDTSPQSESRTLDQNVSFI
uniref:Uncharacterized protein n=1 Tax=viral metagenome TaxID=1070528 RepID=A0A2V0R9B4_9ZZZZ